MVAQWGALRACRSLRAYGVAQEWHQEGACDPLGMFRSPGAGPAHFQHNRGARWYCNNNDNDDDEEDDDDDKYDNNGNYINDDEVVKKIRELKIFFMELDNECTIWNMKKTSGQLQGIDTDIMLER